MTLIIDYVAAVHKSGGNSNCDPWWKESTHCEPYVKVLFDDREVFRSTTKESGRNFWYYELYQSFKIPTSTNVKMEVWDRDQGENDDLVLRAQSMASSLSTEENRFSDGDNKLNVKAHWRTEYQDD